MTVTGVSKANNFQHLGGSPLMRKQTLVLVSHGDVIAAQD